MAYFSKSTENEIVKALDRNDEVIFVLDGKLISIESQEYEYSTIDKLEAPLSLEIENNIELKDSLYSYMEHTDMQKYSKEELKDLRYARRR
ncbi:hypothetical protein CIL05_03835 [Virgibacillus profundi]|uniref:Uncharacterized protein n=1 Tax=Virgibacillus profundi TaxID=2024555 RepID=A0A2A2II80_9BACI|nr:hypothetical protein [Virgibacillus profundi]PAV30860.1 hypothetical protein CIL05_03835 [Virgibacillus profundi]PXY55043.1 hypothetical protein CIT14_03915 [Virgibacillus profundi]